MSSMKKREVKGESVYVVMPAYNEEANIKETVKAWYPIVEKNAKSRLVIADSGSTDKTHKILNTLKKSYPKIEILSDTNLSIPSFDSFTIFIKLNKLFMELLSSLLSLFISDDGCLL